MSRGLTQDLQALIADFESVVGERSSWIPATVQRGRDGLLWHRPEGLGSEDIVTIAESGMLPSRLESMFKLYEAIVDECSDLDLNGLSLDDLPRLASLLEQYFSQFLILHRTYDRLIAKLSAEVGMRAGEGVRLAVLDICLTPGVVQWQHVTSAELFHQKDLFSTEPVLILPEWLRPCRDLEEVRSRLRRVPGLSSCEAAAGAAFRLSEIAVAKEWKFAVNKLLFTRFASVMRPHVVGNPAIRNMHISELTEWIRRFPNE